MPLRFVSALSAKILSRMSACFAVKSFRVISFIVKIPFTFSFYTTKSAYPLRRVGRRTYLHTPDKVWNDKLLKLFGIYQDSWRIADTCGVQVRTSSINVI